MSLNPPFITLGILGSYASSDIRYNINTCIGQSFQDFEIIFCFDRQQCVPVSHIIDSLNAHHFSIENRVKILENKESSGLFCNAGRIAEEAEGNYIFFMSMEDAFYDQEALQRICNALQDNPSHINLFRTLINHNGSWSIYPTAEDPHNTLSICYPKNCLENWKRIQIGDCNHFALFQRELLDQVLKYGYSLHYTDENTTAHICTGECRDLYSYYTVEDRWKTHVAAALSLPEPELKLDLLSCSHIGRLLQLLDIPELTEKEIESEYYYRYRLASDSLWEMPYSMKYYLEALRYLAFCINPAAPQKHKLTFLRRRLGLLKKRKKMKLLFLAHEYSVWPSLQSVYEEALKNSDFEVQLVYVPFFHEYSRTDHARELSQYEKAGYRIISCEDYNLSNESPDVVFYVKPYDSIPERYQVKELRKIMETVVYIPYGMEIGDTEECLYYQCYGNMQYYADYILAYSPYYLQKMQKYTYTKGSNYLSIGHPRIDLRQKKSAGANAYMHSIREKAAHRKIVLWNTHFTLSEGDNWGSFLIYGDHILEYFKCHPDLFLLWRPHPLFYQALAESRKETPEKTLSWLKEITDSENIMLDRAPSYLPAFQVSHAMISDWASMVPEYMAYEKPVLVTPKNNGSHSILSNAEEYFRIVHEPKDIVRFLDNIGNTELNNTANVNYSKLLFFPAKKTVARELLDILRHR